MISKAGASDASHEGELDAIVENSLDLGAHEEAGLQVTRRDGHLILCCWVYAIFCCAMASRLQLFALDDLGRLDHILHNYLNNLASLQALFLRFFGILILRHFQESFGSIFESEVDDVALRLLGLYCSLQDHSFDNILRTELPVENRWLQGHLYLPIQATAVLKVVDLSTLRCANFRYDRRNHEVPCAEEVLGLARHCCILQRDVALRIPRMIDNKMIWRYFANRKHSQRAFPELKSSNLGGGPGRLGHGG